MKRLLGNLLLSLFSLVVFLLFCEAVLWGVSPPPKQAFPKNMFVIADGLWGLSPGFRGIVGGQVDFNEKVTAADPWATSPCRYAPSSA